MNRYSPCARATSFGSTFSAVAMAAGCSLEPSYPASSLRGCIAVASSTYSLDLVKRPRASEVLIPVTSATRSATYLPSIQRDFAFHFASPLDDKGNYSLDFDPPKRVVESLAALHSTTAKDCLVGGRQPNENTCTFVHIVEGPDLTSKLKKQVLDALPEEHRDRLSRLGFQDIIVESAIITSAKGYFIAPVPALRLLAVRSNGHLFAGVESLFDDKRCGLSSKMNAPAPTVEAHKVLFQCRKPSCEHFEEACQAFRGAAFESRWRNEILSTFHSSALAADSDNEQSVSPDEVILRRNDKLSLVLGKPFIELSTYLLRFFAQSGGTTDMTEDLTCISANAGLEVLPFIMLKRNGNSASPYMAAEDDQMRTYREVISSSIQSALTVVCRQIHGTVQEGVCRPEEPVTLDHDAVRTRNANPSIVNIRKLFEKFPALAEGAQAAKPSGIQYQLDISGATGGQWNIDFRAAAPVWMSGTGPADCTIEIRDKDMQTLVEDPESNVEPFFRAGKLEVNGTPSGVKKLKTLFLYLQALQRASSVPVHP